MATRVIEVAVEAGTSRETAIALIKQTAAAIDEVLPASNQRNYLVLHVYLEPGEDEGYWNSTRRRIAELEVVRSAAIRQVS
jgi:hypothetical protein